jgi:hypothetical protein
LLREFHELCISTLRLCSRSSIDGWLTVLHLINSTDVQSQHNFLCADCIWLAGVKQDNVGNCFVAPCDWELLSEFGLIWHVYRISSVCWFQTMLSYCQHFNALWAVVSLIQMC